MVVKTLRRTRLAGWHLHVASLGSIGDAPLERDRRRIGLPRRRS